MYRCFLVSIFFNTLFLPAQDTLPKIEIYQSWTQLLNENSTRAGVLYQLKDSSILISNSLAEYDYYTNNFEVREFNINTIERIVLRRKGSVGKGAWIGALSGFVFGTLVGVAAGSNAYDPFGVVKPGYGLAGGLLGTLFGVSFGAIFGSIKTNIHIGGQFDNYYRNYSKLEQRAIKKTKRKKLTN